MTPGALAPARPQAGLAGCVVVPGLDLADLELHEHELDDPELDDPELDDPELDDPEWET